MVVVMVAEAVEVVMVLMLAVSVAFAVCVETPAAMVAATAMTIELARLL